MSQTTCRIAWMLLFVLHSVQARKNRSAYRPFSSFECRTLPALGDFACVAAKGRNWFW
ncbi:hypothetical protein [Pectobacterium parmentieri]|uniref:Uncharacterized protein n=1 Tax=Pectobacterium parmentieri TaxID=1905730 RepID=A0A0H3I8K3_PECPM|nr:hypothetical protein [Pectobacterium parmentieri]AFI92278.1 Hypothetical protein W5S_4222 [Pectobacterium parmentieri]